MKILLLLLAFSGDAIAQQGSPTFSYSGQYAGRPTACAEGTLGFMTDKPAGQQVQSCANGVWTVVGQGSGGPPTGTVNAVYQGTYPNPGNLRDVLSVKDLAYGALGNTKRLTDGSVSGSVGSPVLNSATASFVSGDIGSIVEIQNSCLNAGVVSTLEGTITSAVSGTAAAMTIDTSSPTHGIVCSALNSAPLLGSILTSISSSATSVYVYLYSPTAIPTPPFNIVLDSGTANQETVSVSAVSQFRNVLTLTMGATAFSHAATISVLLTGTQAVEFSYGADDTAAINSAITAAQALPKASILFPSKTGGYTVRAARNQAFPVCFPLSGAGNLTFTGDGSSTIYMSGAWSVYSGNVVRNTAWAYPSGYSGTVHHLLISNLQVNGMTNGNRGSTTTNPPTSTGEGWDISNHFFFLQNTTADDIQVRNVNWQHNKGEQFYIGGSSSLYTNIVVSDSILADSAAEAFSASASTITIQNNQLSNFGNACSEEGTTGGFVNYMMTGNTCSDSLHWGFVFVGAFGSSVATNTGQHVVTGNSFQYIGIFPAGTSSVAAVGMINQTPNTTAISHVKISGNHMTDSLAAVVPEAVNDSVVSDNSFVVDTMPNTYFPKGVYVPGNLNSGDTVTNLSVTGNTFRRTALAVTNTTQLIAFGLTGTSTASQAQYKNISFTKNTLDNVSYEVFNNTGSAATSWTAYIQLGSAPIFADNIYNNPTYLTSVNTAQVPTTTVYPLAEYIQITPASNATLTIPQGYSSEGQIVRILNISTNIVTWYTDANIDTPGIIVQKQYGIVAFRYSVSGARWLYLYGGTPNGPLTYAQITALSAPANGMLLYCSDCKNFTDNTTGTFDSAIASGGNGTDALYENGAWRVH